MMMGGGILILLALAALVVFLVRGDFGARPSQGDDKRSGPDAREILAERFARGEISKDEYEERRRVLSSDRR
jgi:putative membrane protein